MVTVVEF